MVRPRVSLSNRSTIFLSACCTETPFTLKILSYFLEEELFLYKLLEFLKANMSENLFKSSQKLFLKFIFFLKDDKK
jgi:hypothetical protein